MSINWPLTKYVEVGVKMMCHCVRLISLFHMDRHFNSFSADKMMHKRPSVLWFETWIPNILCGWKKTPIACHCKCMCNLLSTFSFIRPWSQDLGFVNELNPTLSTAIQYYFCLFYIPTSAVFSVLEYICLLWWRVTDAEGVGRWALVTVLFNRCVNREGFQLL